jgi:serine protease Do
MRDFHKKLTFANKFVVNLFPYICATQKMSLKIIVMKKIAIGLVLFAALNLSTKAQEVVIIKKNSKDTTQPLIVIDGIITPQANINDISPNDIKSMNVLKGQMATAKYGTKGENGVIEITSKQKAKTRKLDSTINMTVIVDGDKVTINGQPADKNDPRIIRREKVKINNGDKETETITVRGDTTINDIEIDDMDDASDDMMPPPPPTAMNKAFLGVMSEAVDKGVIIKSVVEGSAAQKAGLKEQDIITKVNDQIIDGPKTLYDIVGGFKPQDKINITYLRDEKEMKTVAVLEKNKNIASNNNFNFNAPNGNMPNIMRRGFKMNPNNPNQNFYFEMPDMPNLDGLTNKFNNKPKLGITIEDLETGEGVKVKSVNEGSPAQKAGFKANDIIEQYDNQKVTDVNDLKWGYLSEGQTLKFMVKRGNDKKLIEVKIPKKLKTADL